MDQRGGRVAIVAQSAAAEARTLRRIEDRWVESGFPSGEEFERIVSAALDEAHSA